MSKTKNSNKTKLVCITGFVNKGKTTTSKIISSMGYDVFIMDEYIHQIYKYGNIGYNAIKNNFGFDFVDTNEVDRNKLREFILSNEQNRKKLNDIMFPIICLKLDELVMLNKVIFVELGIYIYNQNLFHKYFNKVILVDRNDEISKKTPFSKLNNVVKFSTKRVGNLKNANFTNTVFVDYIVDNNGDLENLWKNIGKILERIWK